MKPGVIQTFCQNCHMKCRIFVTLRDNKVQAIANTVDVEGNIRLQILHRASAPQREGKRNLESPCEKMSEPLLLAQP